MIFLHHVGQQLIGRLLHMEEARMGRARASSRSNEILCDTAKAFLQNHAVDVVRHASSNLILFEVSERRAGVDTTSAVPVDGGVAH